MYRPLLESLSAQQPHSFLFAPLNGRWLAGFRFLFALFFAFAFASGRHVPSLQLLDHPLWSPVYERIFLNPPYYFLLLPLLLAWGLGWRTRVTGPLLVLAFLPLMWIQGRVMSRQILLFCLLVLSLPGRSGSPIWPVRMVQIQLSLVYLVNALAKSTPEYLRGDILVGMSKYMSNFQVDLSAGFLVVAGLEIPVGLCAWATVLAEFVLAIGFWIPRLRLPTAIFGVAFHLLIKQVVRIGMLDYTCIFLYLVFLIPWRRGPHAK